VARALPRAAVDVVLFRYQSNELEALIVEIRRGALRGRWAFPGGRVRRGEPLDEAARREIREHTPSPDLYVEQLFTFGEPARDPAAHVISTTYLGLLASGEPAAPSSKYSDRAWVDVRRLPSLAYDHDHVARVALERLRAKVSYTNVAYALLPREFTIAELQRLYQVVLAKRFDRRNFRKKLLASGLLVPLRRQRLGAHRPAALYAFRERQLRWLAGI
jgi:8-oxo-dGTP diphosphatase